MTLPSWKNKGEKSTCRAPGAVDYDGQCGLCRAHSRRLYWGRPTQRLHHLPTLGRLVILESVRSLALGATPDRATYQRHVISGDWWSGAELKGKAKRYGASYWRSREVAAARIVAAAETLGVEIQFSCGERDVDGQYQRSRRLDLVERRFVCPQVYQLAYPAADLGAPPRMMRFEVQK